MGRRRQGPNGAAGVGVGVGTAVVGVTEGVGVGVSVGEASSSGPAWTPPSSALRGRGGLVGACLGGPLAPSPGIEVRAPGVGAVGERRDGPAGDELEGDDHQHCGHEDAPATAAIRFQRSPADLAPGRTGSADSSSSCSARSSSSVAARDLEGGCCRRRAAGVRPDPAGPERARVTRSRAAAWAFATRSRVTRR